MLPPEILESANALIQMEKEREALYDRDDNDGAFALEQDQRAEGLVLADWILKNSKKLS
jgi:hypothetical protein